jgi:hypothetical protein
MSVPIGLEAKNETLPLLILYKLWGLFLRESGFECIHDLEQLAFATGSA